MAKPSISYTPRPDSTPASEISALVAVYRLCLRSHASKRGRLLDKSGPNDGTKVKEDSANENCST